MVRHGKTVFIAGLALAVFLTFSLAASAGAGIVDSFKESWSEAKSSLSSKSKSGSTMSEADQKKMNTGASGCIEGVLNAKARGSSSGFDFSAACADGANKSIQEADAKAEREEQELLARKDAQSWGQRIDRVNERIVDRQPRIERIKAEKEGKSEPLNEDDIVMDKRCRKDPSCREAVIKIENESANPGFFAGMWYWVFPGKAPKAKAELRGIERDISFLKRSIGEIKDGIEAIEDRLLTTDNVKQKSDLARDKGTLISQMSQATQALAVLKTQQGELDKGYAAYLLMFFAAIGGTIVKKVSDGAVSFSLDGAKAIIKRTRRRKIKTDAPQHNMYG